MRALALIVLVGLSAVFAAATSAFGAERGAFIELYSGPNFTGDVRRYQSGWGDLAKDGFNDRAESLRAAGRWQVCEHADLRGQCVEVQGDVADLSRRGFARTISSLQLVGQGYGREGAWGGRRGGLVLYEGEGFAGRSVSLDAAVDNLAGLGFNDAARALEARGRWIVCEHARFAGRCAEVEGPIGDLRQIGLFASISSARRVDDDLAGGPWPGEPDWGGGGDAPAAEGRTAAFFPHPRGGARALEFCRERGCARDAAANFCARQGYRDVAYFQVSRSGRRGDRLEDVLCVR
jgi:hypothetical protein